MRHIHWPFLLGATAGAVILLALVALLKAEFFVVVLPLVLIGCTCYVLYIFLLSLGWGDEKPAEKKEIQEKESVGEHEQFEG